MEKKLEKPYPKNYNLLIAQDLWQTHYQVLLIILPKAFMKLNVNMDMIIRCEACRIKYKDCKCGLTIN